MTASNPSPDGDKDVSENSKFDHGPVYAEYRLGDEIHEVPDPTWSVMPSTVPDDDFVLLDLIGYDTGEWSVKLTPEQACRMADALKSAAGAGADA